MIQKALFGAGCFWGVEEHFRTLKGVNGTEVGYSGGKTKNPTYESVCYENTDHAEVLLIEFDDYIISYLNFHALERMYNSCDSNWSNSHIKSLQKQQQSFAIIMSKKNDENGYIKQR